MLITDHFKVTRETFLDTGEGRVPPGECVCVAKWTNGETGHISVPYILHTKAFEKYFTSVNNGVEIGHNTYRTVFRMRMQHERLANALANLNINPTTSTAPADPPARQQPPTTSSAAPARQQPPQNSSRAPRP
uniref:Uncharacterized protein n=1 Tax=Panagrolaimus sp. PS1159 TaxID=55785 RepID=A0AC35FG86_9BILA